GSPHPYRNDRTPPHSAHADARPRVDTQGRNGGLHQELAAGGAEQAHYGGSTVSHLVSPMREPRPLPKGGVPRTSLTVRTTGGGVSPSRRVLWKIETHATTLA